MAMIPYNGTRHDSGVVAYEIGPDFIRVKFRGGGIYCYSHRSAGALKVARMKELAKRGSGLATFITRYAKDDFDRDA